MPGLDGTGPLGAGPMTGGGFGLCNPYGRTYGWWPAFRFGRGFRRGFGPGRGRGRWFGRGIGWRSLYPAGWFGAPYAAFYGAPYPYAPRPEDELNMLKEEADMVRNELEAINKRIEELESKTSQS
ncbi:MAG: DUF5320 domain-containing protein [Deltaproteobacteria bacterium]|nr:DUF5320 domain-containing protein [Deltaproteobacteria bacterium]MBW1963042.1 DUF5320 domain-containing protein [Deltaproteobacteria bacterium]MBW1992959.1 DUF5320 domain-containing protein [Deltaproteobacteria bacterium]MBW2152845.1 DUF5320 domain-containing protein [Deltaproteobacteria bacterium]